METVKQFSSGFKLASQMLFTNAARESYTRIVREASGEGGSEKYLVTWTVVVQKCTIPARSCKGGRFGCVMFRLQYPVLALNKLRSSEDFSHSPKPPITSRSAATPSYVSRHRFFNVTSSSTASQADTIWYDREIGLIIPITQAKKSTAAEKKYDIPRKNPRNSIQSVHVI